MITIIIIIIMISTRAWKRLSNAIDSDTIRVIIIWRSNNTKEIEPFSPFISLWPRWTWDKLLLYSSVHIMVVLLILRPVQSCTTMSDATYHLKYLICSSILVLTLLCLTINMLLHATAPDQKSLCNRPTSDHPNNQMHFFFSFLYTPYSFDC